MLDYRAIEALYMICQLQSFEKAAAKLFITQSAISQRIKQLENHYKEPLLVRILPYRPTPLGQTLVTHFKKVCLLEEELTDPMLLTNPLSLSIALNRDSLETWFLSLIDQKGLFQSIALEILAVDQEHTLDLLKNGLVSGCVSTSTHSIVGGKVQCLGKMDYVLVASPDFAKKYFSPFSKDVWGQAPAVKFDQNDRLHERYLEKFFSYSSFIPYHIIPSVRGFKKYILQGYGYGLIPKIDMQEELKKKHLVEISTEKVWELPLYWHYWAIQSKPYQKFNEDFTQQASKLLAEKK